jgi:hypothetical protein
MALSIITPRIIILNIMILYKMTRSIMSVCKTTLSIMTLSIID